MEKSLLIIIPCYNEASRITSNEFNEALKGYPHSFLLVNDGSTDSTENLLDQAAAQNNNLAVLNIKQNVGKAEAIRQAVLMQKIHYDFIAYLDADFAAPVSEVHKMKLFAESNGDYLLIMGSRIKKMGSEIQRYNYRHYFGRVFATIVSNLILKVPVYDTQCGAKIIDYHLAKKLFAEPFITKWLFDVELLKRYSLHDSAYNKKVYEFSLAKWTEKGKSKITFKDLISFPYQLFKIYTHYGSKKYN